VIFVADMPKKDLSYLILIIIYPEAHQTKNSKPGLAQRNSWFNAPSRVFQYYAAL